MVLSILESVYSQSMAAVCEEKQVDTLERELEY